MRHAAFTILAVLALAPVAGAQQSFYSHDNYTQYELLDPESHQFAISYWITERRAGATYLLNQTRSGSEGSDISVFDPRTGKPLKFDYMTGAELTSAGMTGRFDPAEHYIRAHLPQPVPEGGEGRVKILKTYKDDKSYYTEGEDIVFKRSLGIARNSIVLPKGFRLVASNVAAQMFTLPDGRLKISFEHAHGYAADVTIRARRLGAALPPARIVSERAFDWTKVLYDIKDFSDSGVAVVQEYVESRRGEHAEVRRPVGMKEFTVTDVDTGRVLPVTKSGQQMLVKLDVPIANDGQSARLRVSGPAKLDFQMGEGAVSWMLRSEFAARIVVLLPPGWDVAAVSTPATVSTQTDGRVAIQIYGGDMLPIVMMNFTAAKR
jgi:hypothetical protein